MTNRYRVTINYQRPGGDAATAAYEVNADNEQAAADEATRLLYADERRRVQKIDGGDVEKAEG